MRKRIIAGVACCALALGIAGCAAGGNGAGGSQAQKEYQCYLPTSITYITGDHGEQNTTEFSYDDKGIALDVDNEHIKVSVKRDSQNLPIYYDNETYKTNSESITEFNYRDMSNGLPKSADVVVKNLSEGEEYNSTECDAEYFYYSNDLLKSIAAKMDGSDSSNTQEGKYTYSEEGYLENISAVTDSETTQAITTETTTKDDKTTVRFWFRNASQGSDADPRAHIDITFTKDSNGCIDKLYYVDDEGTEELLCKIEYKLFENVAPWTYATSKIKAWNNGFGVSMARIQGLIGANSHNYNDVGTADLFTLNNNLLLVF